jgi:hypothetical protein
LACLPALLAAVFLAGCDRLGLSNVADPPAEPRLVVLVYFDQLRGDYLSRWQSLFGERGFRRLQTEGAWYTNCHYPYSDTVTGPGHASVATGCSPAVHGIIANEWLDRASGEEVYCVAGERYQRVPYAPPVDKGRPRKAEDRGAGSPERLLAPTIADALKEATGGKAHVIGLSLKDRAAILPAGQHPDGCYWFDLSSGQFVTSTYYRNQLPAWVADFNRDRPGQRWFNKTWERLRPTLDYSAFSGPDEAPGEGKGIAQGRTFPHPMNGGLREPGKASYGALFNSPFGNDLLLDFARHAIEAEGLGRHSCSDFLSISFSSNDAVGHCWGPDSQEVLDTTLRSDQIMEQLLDYLDNRIGVNHYVLAVTADHGICPLPEVSRSQKKDAGRIAPDLLGARADKFLAGKFGTPDARERWIESRSDQWVYLNRKLLKAYNREAPVVEEALASWLKQQPGVMTAYTRSELIRGVAANDAVGQRVLRSFHAERSGDVVAILKPLYLLTPPLATGTLHGTPHSYDTHVPLLVYGPGISRGVRDSAVTPQATAAILARALHIAPPAKAEAPVPD